MEREMDKKLTEEQRTILLGVARQALQAAAAGGPLPPIDLDRLPPVLRADGAAFVTLTRGDLLRGCIGALEASQPLAIDVRDHAVAAATQDYRFPPVRLDELPSLQIEISRLTPMKQLEYDSPQDLLEKVRPGIDGVVIRDGMRRATFLPQVWEKVVSKEEFFSHLCIKMGAPPDCWQGNRLEVFTYQVEEFKEEN